MPHRDYVSGSNFYETIYPIGIKPEQAVLLFFYLLFLAVVITKLIRNIYLNMNCLLAPKRLLGDP